MPPNFEVHPQHPNFANAGKKEGLQIWRIENFEPVPISPTDFGKFYTGDSYIILRTRDYHGSFDWNLHFWLGSETCADESGAAAIYTIQLDDMLGGGPTQHRETQGNESQLFLSHFKSGIRYLPGGFTSGFHHYDPKITKRLFLVKGKKHVRAKQVECAFKSLNKMDCFILEAGLNIFVYIGPKSKKLERIKAINLAHSIRDDDDAGKGVITVIDEFASELEIDKFFETIGEGTYETVAGSSQYGDDEIFEHKIERLVKLFKVTEVDGEIKIEKIAKKPLKREMLDSNDCFILDTRRSDLYVWIGKKCHPKEKATAMKKAQHFLTSKKHPAYTRVQRIVDGGEPSMFKQYFSGWNQPKPEEPVHEVTPKDVLTAYHCKLTENNKLITYEIQDLEQEDLDEEDVIIVVTHTTIYVWHGRESSREEKDLCNRKAETFMHGGQEHIEIIEQNKEPKAFVHLFPKWDYKFWFEQPSFEQRRANAIKGLIHLLQHEKMLRH